MTLAYLYCAAEGFGDDGLDSRVGRDGRAPEAAQYDAAYFRALVEHVRQGDERAFERLFRLFYTRVVRYVTALVRDRTVAEDVAQAMFTRLWERRAEWTVQTTVEAYLIRAARNGAIDAMRHDQREHRWDAMQDDSPAGAVPSAFDATDRGAERHDLIRHVRRAVAQLPTRHREILALKWGGGYTHAEIGEITGQPVRTVETQVARAVKALRILLDGAIG